MKIIKYKFLSAEINHGTEKEPNIEQVVLDKSMECPTKAIYEANLRIAEAEAIPGTLDRDPLGEFDPEPVAEPTEVERLEALEAAMLELMGVETDG